jgi:hypothetical protein
MTDENQHPDSEELSEQELGDVSGGSRVEQDEAQRLQQQLDLQVKKSSDPAGTFGGGFNTKDGTSDATKVPKESTL